MLLIVEVVGGVQSIVQSSCTAKQAKEDRGGESLPKKRQLLVAKKNRAVAAKHRSSRSSRQKW